MSDLLSILAARIRPVAPPIEPRRGPLFEELTRGTMPVEVAEETTTMPALPATTTQPSSTTETPRLPGPQIQPAPVATPLPLSAPAVTLPPPVVPFTAPTPVPVVEPVCRVVTNEKPEAPPLEKDLVAPREVPLTSPPNFAGLTHSILTEKSVSVPSPHSVVPAQTNSREMPLAPRAAPLLSPPVVRLIDPSPRAGAQSEPRSIPAEPPVIRVTIGRVEVRALVPPTLQQTQPPAAKKSVPVISLEDYLKQQPSFAARS